MEDWGRYGSDTSSSSEDDDDIYFGDFRKKQSRKCDVSVIHKNGGNKGNEKFARGSVNGGKEIPVHRNPVDDASFSSSSSEGPIYEITGDFSCSDSSLNDSNTPLDLSTPKGWKHSKNISKKQIKANRPENIQSKPSNSYSHSEQLKWPTQRGVKQKTDVNRNIPSEQNAYRKSVSQQSVSSFSSTKGEIGESPDFSNLETPSPCDDSSPLYQNTMRAKRLFDSKQQYCENVKPPMSSVPSLASLNAFGLQGHEGLSSYTSLPQTSHLDESSMWQNEKGLSQLPSSSSMMTTFNETIQEREGMASLSNYSSMSSMLMKTGVKGTINNSELSPLSLVSNFTEPLGEVREGLASYNSLLSLYRSPSESNYGELRFQKQSKADIASSDYIEMSKLQYGEGMSSHISLPNQNNTSSSSGENSLDMNTTIVANSDYVDMKRLNENSKQSKVIHGKKKSSDAHESNVHLKKIDKLVDKSSRAYLPVLREHFFNEEDLSGDYVELSKCQAYMAAMRKKEIKPESTPAVDQQCRTISPSPIVNLSVKNKDDVLSNSIKHPLGNISSASLVSFYGNPNMEHNLTIGESLCERREGMASVSSLSEYDFTSDVSSTSSLRNANPSISQAEISSHNFHPSSVHSKTSHHFHNYGQENPDREHVPSLVIGADRLTCVGARKGTFSDSGVDCGSVSSPLDKSDQVFVKMDKSDQVISKTDPPSCSQGIPPLQDIPEVFSGSASSSSLNTSSAACDSGSASLAQSMSQTSTASDNSISNCERSVLQTIEKITENIGQAGACSNCPVENNTSSSVCESASHTSNTSSNYASRSNSSHDAVTNTDIKSDSTPLESNPSNLTDIQENNLHESKSSVHSDTINASLLSLYGNGASTPRASTRTAVTFPSNLQVSPIATYSRVQNRGGRVVRSPCVKPSMLKLKDSNNGNLFDLQTDPNKCENGGLHVHSANVNSGSVKNLKDKNIMMDSFATSNSSNTLRDHPETDGQGGDEEEVQMVYANAFRRIDVGSNNTPSNVVVKSTIKRVPSMNGPSHTVQPHLVDPKMAHYSQTNDNSYTRSLGSLNAQSMNTQSQHVTLRAKTATIKTTRPQSAMGRIQGESSTMPRSSRSHSKYSQSHVKRLPTGESRRDIQISPQRGMLPDIIPFPQQGIDDEDMLPAAEVFYHRRPVQQKSVSAPHVHMYSTQQPPSNYMPMTRSTSDFSRSSHRQNMHASAYIQAAPEGHYEMDSSSSSLECDNFSFGYNQPEDFGKSVMVTSAADFRQLEETAEAGVYEDIDEYGAYGGEDYNPRHYRQSQKMKFGESDLQQSFKPRRVRHKDKENSLDRQYYPKSPLPHGTKDKRSEPSSPKKTSRFFGWPIKVDSSPKSKLFGTKKKDKKDKSKRRKEMMDRYEQVPIVDHDTDWKTKLHTLCNGRRVVRYLNYSESEMIIKHYPPPKESTKIKWNSNLVQLHDGESDDSNEYAVIHPKSILSKKLKEYKYDGDAPSPIIITKTRQTNSLGRRSSHK